MPLVLLTGQSRGLGKAIVEGFKAAGFDVPRCLRSDLDVSSSESIDACLDRIGSVDVLVNNAAVLGPVGNAEDNDWQEWERALSVNLFGAVHLTQAVLPSMKRKGAGRIINIAGGGATNSLPRRSAYATSKAALVRFTECVADEARDDGIAVNAILPGPMPTDMLDDILAAGPKALGEAEYDAHLRLKQDDTDAIERAAALCLYLASRESDGLTGRTISARFDPWPFDRNAIAEIMATDRYTLRRTKE